MRASNKDAIQRPIVIAGILILGIVLWSGLGEHGSTTLRVGEDTFSTELATTQSAQEKGLSGRASLTPDQSMLFVYSSEDRRCMWMKGMQFAIDIVWLDSKKRVIAAEQNVQPDSYPTSFCHEGAQYVIEFANGTAERLRLNPGDVFRF